MAMTSQSTLPLRAEFVANPAAAFAAAMLTLVAAAAVLAGWFPLGFSIVIVFLFAGPHNWLEARYFMTRMPARWGRLRGFFTLGIAGVVGLTAGMVALPTLAAALGDDLETWRFLLAVWNSTLVLWAATLAAIRRGQNPRRQWAWLWPAAFGLITLAWLWPVGWGIGLVYLHPLVALAFFDAEITRRRPDLRATWRWCLLAVPVAIVFLAWRLGDAADLAGTDVLTAQITRHAGGGVVPHVSTHFLVAAHTFLEMLHYGIWCAAVSRLAGGADGRAGRRRARRGGALGRVPDRLPAHPQRLLHHGARACAGRGAVSRAGGLIACHPIRPPSGVSCPGAIS